MVEQDYAFEKNQITEASFLCINRGNLCIQN